MAGSVRASVYAVLLLLLAALPLQAQEHISRFSSHITVRPDGRLNVTEHITVHATGTVFRHGLYRDLPLTDEHSGKAAPAMLRVHAVRLNDHKAPYHTARTGGHLRVYIGDKDALLPRGTHTFTLVYTTGMAITLGSVRDALVWNVTGGDWQVAIHEAQATVELPSGTAIRRHETFSGRYGSRRKTVPVLDKIEDSTLHAATDGALMPGQQMTVAVAFDSGVVQPLVWSQLAGWPVAAMALLLLGVLLLLNYVFWHWRGRDPTARAVMPRFTPPENISAGGVHHVWNYGNDGRALYAASITGLAAKGYLTIEETGRNPFKKEYVAFKASETIDRPALGADEKSLLEALFRYGERYAFHELTPLDTHRQEDAGGIFRRFRSMLTVTYDRQYFHPNTWLRGLAFLAMAGVVAGASQYYGHVFHDTSHAVSLLCAGIVVALAGFALGRWWIYRRQAQGSRTTLFPSFIERGLKYAFVYFFRLFVVLGVAAGGTLLQLRSFDSLFAVTLLVLFIAGIMQGVFDFLLQAPTVQGQRLREHLAGFRLYLGRVEAPQWAKDAPEDTPELYARYLPYAIALGVENEWGERFAKTLASLGSSPWGGSTVPGWYHGHGFTGAVFARQFGTQVQQSFSTSSASASGGGSWGGGGFSGGGRGGGGGGGW